MPKEKGVSSFEKRKKFSRLKQNSKISASPWMFLWLAVFEFYNDNYSPWKCKTHSDLHYKCFRLFLQLVPIGTVQMLRNPLTPWTSVQFQPHGNPGAPASRLDSNVSSKQSRSESVCTDRISVIVALELLQNIQINELAFWTSCYDQFLVFLLALQISSSERKSGLCR